MANSSPEVDVPVFRRDPCVVSSAEYPDERLKPSEILRAALDVALANVEGPLVLAVSGGRDSMTLLFALARWAPHRIAAVATFDHATGAHASDAASLVAAEGRRLGLTVVRERARVAGTTEAAWRELRWNFLHRVARAHRARVATAHTRDDQVETVFMRALRGAGARGLAALAAPSPVVRPWLGVARQELLEWASSEAIPFIDDPTNATAQFLRGRVRHELLPAVRAVSPGFDDALLGIAERAAMWRCDVETLVDTMSPSSSRPGVLRVAAAPIEGTSDGGRAVLWQALFARIGVILDARGTRELVRFTNATRRGAMVTLAKGAVALRVAGRHGDEFELRRGERLERRSTVFDGIGARLPARVGRWRFRRVLSGLPEGSEQGQQPWVFGLSALAEVTVRLWQPGDRIQTAGAPTGRRVTRYFAEAHVPALDRLGWPVVLVEDVLVWVPGICRSLAAPHRPGRSDLIWYRCEREHD